MGPGGPEGEGRSVRRGVVWHAGVPVVQHVRARQGLVKLCSAAACAFAFGFPELLVPLRAKAVCGLGEQEDDDGSDLFRGVVEVVLCDFTERWVAGAQEGYERHPELSELRREECEWVGAGGGRRCRHRRVALV